MSILIVGAEGSMGKRYQAILKYLGKSYVGTDIAHREEHVKELAEKSSGIIIATPTYTHTDLIRRFMHLRKPILCEKPVTKNIQELRSLLEELKQHKTMFRMMYQYSVMVDDNRIGKSLYNYFKHGNDGLIWDCMQIIGLSRQECVLGDTSPVWRCMINGKSLRIEHMDAAYINYVQKWFSYPGQDFGQILAVHERTAEAERKQAHGGVH